MLASSNNLAAHVPVVIKFTPANGLSEHRVKHLNSPQDRTAGLDIDGAASRQFSSGTVAAGRRLDDHVIAYTLRYAKQLDQDTKPDWNDYENPPLFW